MNARRLATECIAITIVMLASAIPAGAQLLVPSCQVVVEQGADASNALSSQADLTVTSAGGTIHLGRNAFFENGTSVSGSFLAIGNGGSVDDVNVDTIQLGKNAVVRGTQGGFTASTFVCPAPAASCSGPSIDVGKRGSQSLDPGNFGDVSLQNGATLTLAPGPYTFCSLQAGRNSTIEIEGPGQTTITVTGNVQLQNDTAFGPVGSAATPVLNVLGASVRFSSRTLVRAFVQAPNAELELGRGATFIGAACAQSLDTSRVVQLICAPETPGTTTTTTTTTSTTTSSAPVSSSTSTSSTTSAPSSSTTTTTTGPTCGNGVKDPGEECDTNDFGGRTCQSSPSGALLCTANCTIDFAECPGDAPSSTTTTTVASTTTTSSTTTPTSSTTTTTTGPTCGNGVKDPGEECDQNDFGGRTCQSSPSGALLCTGNCTIDFSQCPGDASTTTTTQAPVTTTSSSTSTSTIVASTTTSTSGPETTTSTTSLAPTTTTSSTAPISTTTSSTAPIPTTTSSTAPIPTTTSSSTSLAPTTTSLAPTTTTSSTSTSSTTSTTQPALTSLQFVVGQPGGNCGETRDGANALIKNLTCGGLSIGAGGSIVPEGPTPDGSISRYALSCAGSSCTVSANSTAPAVNSAQPDCTNTGCNFGTPLPIPNPTIPNITTCVLNTFASPGSGTFNVSTGVASLTVSLSSDIYLTGNLAQPCPKCSASGSPSSPGTGTCDRGPRAGMACTSTSSFAVTRDCPTGGTDAGHPCTPGGGACIDGSHVGAIAVNLSPLTTGTATSTNAGGLFCPSQTHAGCFGSAACRTITENGAAAGAVTPGVPKAATLASTFCIAATGNGLVDASADLPGPGAVSLVGTFETN